MATEMMTIKLHKFTGPDIKGHVWRVMLHWNGCGSVNLTGDMTRKRDAVKEYLRYKRIASNSWGKVHCSGYLQALESVKVCLDESYRKCFEG